MGLAKSETLPRSQDTLVQGGQLATRSGVLAAGQVQPRGAVIGRIAASGVLTLANAGANDGSQIPVGILVHDIDASASETSCQYYSAGDFNTADLTWHASYSDADKMAVFDRTSIKPITL